MLRLDSLNAKQDALDLSLKRRESILRELFRATLAFRKTKSKDAVNYSEDSFLGLNNILEGRPFNAGTLPSLSLTPTTGSDKRQASEFRPGVNTGLEPGENALPRTIRLSATSETNHAGREGRLVEQNSARSILPAAKPFSPEQERQDGQLEPSAAGELSLAKEGPEGQDVPSMVLEQLGTSDPSIDPDIAVRKTTGATGEQPPVKAEVGVDTSVALPIPLDDVGNLPHSTSETIRTELILGDAHPIQLPSKEVQEHRNHDNDEALQSSELVFTAPSGKEQVPGGPLDRLEDQDVNQDVVLSPTNGLLGLKTSGQTDHGSVLRSQMDTVRADAAYTGTPQTPDEQLRLEEAQALQLSRLPSTTSEGYEAPIRQSTSATSAATGNLGTTDDEQSVKFPTPFLEMNGQTKVNDDRSGPSRAVETPKSVIRATKVSGVTGGLSDDLTFSRRPPMRIDTDVAPASDISVPIPGRRTMALGTAPFSPSETATGDKAGPTTSQVHSPPERMTTRVSSGAIRHKSVSEILGETPRHSNSHNEKVSSEKPIHGTPQDESVLYTPRSAISQASPDAVAFKQRLNELKEKERSKLSTVVFARQAIPSTQRPGDLNHGEQDDVSQRRLEPIDYLLPLFSAQATVAAPSQTLHSLVVSAHKTLTTTDHCTDTQEQQDCRILTRIYQLQSLNRWSLRQNERTVEPTRPKAHWDVLLSQMSWMRTDFREERKWKLAAAKNLAFACAQWVTSPLDERSFLQVELRSIRPRRRSHSTAEQTPELIPSAEDDSDSTDFEPSDLEVGKHGAPASIFSLPPDMFVFGLDKTIVAEKILSELPLYRPSVQVQGKVLGHSQEVLEDSWKTPIVPVSKFAQGKIIMQEQGPPRKRSRYNYSRDESHLRLLTSQHGTEDEDADVVAPEKDDVALFRPENKHIRDRIHAGHAFRPPSEYLMPSQSFFESRQPSQWTQGEDDELRRLVREYAYNWSLISSCLSSPSVFSSGAERRTPWECFERWISLEGLPGEMSKTQYFKAYHARLQAAQRNYEAQQQALQQHQGNNGQLPLRRRTTFPFLVERRRNNRHLHLVDAMRKLAKKRETALHKQQHVAGLAALRKQNEAVQPRTAMHTPQEFSRVKYEREQKVQENARLYQQQIVQQRDKAKNQRLGGPGSGQNMIPRGPSYPPAANGSSPNVTSGLPNGHGQATPMSQMRPAPPIARLSNGTQVPSSLPTNSQGVPHAPMQPQMQMQHRMPAQMMTDNARIYQEATRLQEQQRRYLAAQTQHQHPQSNGQASSSASPPNMNHLNALSQNNASLQSNASIYGGLQGRSGSPSMNGPPATAGSSSSPRMTNPSQPQPLSSGMVPVINQMQNQIKARNPQASPEQVKAMTTESLHQYRMSQAAMQAAAGNPSSTGGIPSHNGLNGLPSQPQQQAVMSGMNGSPMLNSARAQYAAMVHSQQAQQSRGSGSGMNAPRPASRSGTPQTHPGHAPSQSPRPSQAQMAGGQ